MDFFTVNPYRMLDDRESLNFEFNGVVAETGVHSVISDCLAAIPDLAEFMKLVLESKEVAFDIQRIRGRRYIEGRLSLARYYRHFYRIRYLYSLGLEYSPDLQLLMDCFKDHPVNECICESPGHPMGDGKTEADVFNDFIHYLRLKAKEQNTRKKLRDWHRNPGKQAQRARRYVNSLLARFAKLLVIRIDLYYRETSLTERTAREAAVVRLDRAASIERGDWLGRNDAGQVWEEDQFARVSIKQALADQKKFIRKMKGNATFKKKVGQIRKTEWSTWGGYHFHWVFFYDGRDVENDYLIAKRIGEHWEKVTEGRGYYHNCNQSLSQYKRRGIGMVEHHDKEKCEYLHEALAYLTKKDQFVRAKELGGRNFQTGNLKEPSGLGRPRRKGK